MTCAGLSLLLGRLDRVSSPLISHSRSMRSDGPPAQPAMPSLNLLNGTRYAFALQALMARLNPTDEPRVSFAAFSAGLHGWLTEHAAPALPSPAASQESEECAYHEENADKENVSSPSPLRELAADPNQQQRSPPRTSPGKQLLQQVRAGNSMY